MPILKVSSVGPPPEVVALARWAGPRWGTDRLRPFLVAASPPKMVAGLGRSRRTVAAASEAHVFVSAVYRNPPLTDPLPLVTSVVRTGPTIVVHPSHGAARAIAARLRKAGFTVALVPDEWAAAAAGVDVVVGTRVAAWAPCPGLRAVVVLDEHDEAHREERTPNWHARDVLTERATRDGAACVLVSPCPTATAMHWAGARVSDVPLGERVGGWPFLEIDDLGDVEPWKRSLVGSRLNEVLCD